MYSSGVEIRPSGVLLGRLSPVIDPKWWNHSGVRLYASRQEVEDEGAPAGPAGGALGGEQRCGPPCPLEKNGCSGWIFGGPVRSFWIAADSLEDSDEG